jgi:hypothetical protein
MATTWTTLYDNGAARPDDVMRIEERPDGLLCLTTDALTREVISRWLYGGLTAQQVGESFAGVPDDLHHRIMTQIFG